MVFARYHERTWVRPIDEGNAYPSRPRDELRIALAAQRHRDPWRHRKLNLHPYIPPAVGPHTRLRNDYLQSLKKLLALRIFISRDTIYSIVKRTIRSSS